MTGPEFEGAICVLAAACERLAAETGCYRLQVESSSSGFHGLDEDYTSPATVVTVSFGAREIHPSDLRALTGRMPVVGPWLTSGGTTWRHVVVDLGPSLRIQAQEVMR